MKPTPARKSIVQLAYELNAIGERRTQRIKKTYAPKPAPVKKVPAKKGRTK